uniref:Uncharacterized protein n=1 Tax=Avena sativa TaxID=4498 RepID=A0ACD5YUW0_AVESA
MHLQADEEHLQYFMPRQPQDDAADRPDSAACASSSTASPAATMWEYHQQAHAALHPSPSWNPYAGTTTAALLDGPAGPAFTAESVPAVADMHLPAGDHVHGHAWSHSELGTGYRENFLDLLASKNVTPDMFEDVPAGRYATAPAAALTARFEAGSDVSPIKYEDAVAAGLPLFLGSGSNAAALEAQGMNLLSCMPSYVDGHHQRKESRNHQQQQEHGNPMASFLQQISTRTSAGVHASLDYSGLGGLDKICQEGRAMEAASPYDMRSVPGFSSFGGYRSTKESTSVPNPPYMRGADSRQEQEIVPARSSSSTGSGAAPSDRKKRSSEERRESTGKKSKQQASAASPPKQQVPKVKLGEKITALQQIVSPFGKVHDARKILNCLFSTLTLAYNLSKLNT